ncbi:MAG: phosphoenolpyruvate synthase [Phycisphaerales bacterium]|nr:MAG: phosphoenolpyruvate synthase [Phycisphaerales bacterium]
MSVEEGGLVRWLKDVGLDDISLVGGKNASLGELMKLDGIQVPNGFAITTNAFKVFMEPLKKQVNAHLARLEADGYSNVTLLEEVSREIRELIEHEPFDKSFEQLIEDAFNGLERERNVAVRSSATAEDLPEASFAGQQDTFLNVSSLPDLLNKVRRCFSSLYTGRAMSYRHEMGFPEDQVSLSVGVQEMVRADWHGVSGVMFTIDTETGNENLILITPHKGLGEAIVQGEVKPDEIYVLRHSLRVIQNPLQFLADEHYASLAAQGLAIEEHYAKKHGRRVFMDIEWAQDGESKELFILQARPETIHSRKISYKRYFFVDEQEEREVLAKGRPVGMKVGHGVATVLKDVSQMDEFEEGQVLVTEMTNPDWEPIMKRASAIVTDQGGRTCHAAIVAREMGITCVVGTETGTKAIAKGAEVTVSCVEGDHGTVFSGYPKYDVEEINLDNIPRTRTQVMLNVGSPEKALASARLPQDGVGLARLEFIIASHIGQHPLYLMKLGQEEVFVDKLASGMSRIAGAFYPKPVIFRFSDFKTNEYANLIGGAGFEPKEENPMIGWRGASRYYDERYREAFKLECVAVKRVIERYGLDNTNVMVPFVRTPQEAEKVRRIIEDEGVKAGVYMMCEIPSNVILAKDFLPFFEGFSIGSNDLTQTTLGLDRDSALVSHLYDERNGAVTKLIADVIETCKSMGKKIGLCGQGPSDFPDFAEFLVKCGIDSFSVTPDVAVKTRLLVAEVEEKMQVTVPV